MDKNTILESELRIRDLMMLQSASNYNLSDKAERKRSTKDLEKLFFQGMYRLKTNVFIEAGAKDAGASKRARKMLPNADVVAFEANPYTYAVFKDENKAAGVDYRHCALSDKKGTIQMNVRKDEKGNPIADGQASLLVSNYYELGHILVDVDSYRLDDLFQDKKDMKGAMWVDVEGALEMVLSGASETLTKTNIAFIEVEDRKYWDKQWLDRDVHLFMMNRGFFPIARDFQSRYQYNVVYVTEYAMQYDLFRNCMTDFYFSPAGNPENKEA